MGQVSMFSETMSAIGHSMRRWALTPVGFRWAPTFGGGVVWQSHRVVRAVIVSCREIGRVDQP